MLTPILLKYPRKGNYIHKTQSTSSFQALLVISMNMTADHIMDINWSSSLREVKRRQRENPWGESHICVPRTSQNGLIHMMIHTNRSALFRYYLFRFHCSDTYSNAVDVFCQCGGVWFYSSSERSFSNPVLLLEKCSNDVFSGPLYSKLKYIAVAVVQYSSISSIIFKYRLNRASVESFFHVSPVYPNQAVVVKQQFRGFQIFTKAIKLDNVSLHLPDASHTQFVSVNINFKHFTPEKGGCECEAIIWHVPYQRDEQSWCTSVVQKLNLIRKIFLSGGPFEIGWSFKIRPKLMRLDCIRCFASSLILFQLKIVYLDAYQESYNQTSSAHVHHTLLTGKYRSSRDSKFSYKKVKYWIYNRKQRAEDFEVRFYGRERRNTSSLSSSVTFTECVNGKKFIMQDTVYAGSTVHHLSQGCVNDCLISITANEGGSNDKSLWVYFKFFRLQTHISYNVNHYTPKANNGLQR